MSTETKLSPLTKEERFNFIVNYAFGGWHHVERKKSLQCAVKFSVYCGSLSTYDADCLTKLVLSCHAVFVRAEIQQSGPRMVAVTLSTRTPHKDGDSFWQRHPSGHDIAKEAIKLAHEIEARGGVQE